MAGPQSHLRPCLFYQGLTTAVHCSVLMLMVVFLFSTYADWLLMLDV